MYKLLLIAFSFGFFTVSYSQEPGDTVGAYAKLSIKYDAAYLKTLKEKTPAVFDYIYYFVNHSYEIIDYPVGKVYPEINKINPKSRVIISEPITPEDLNNFNIHNFDYSVKYDTRNFYKLGNTGKCLIMYSSSEIARQFNLSKNK